MILVFVLSYIEFCVSLRFVRLRNTLAGVDFIKLKTFHFRNS